MITVYKARSIAVNFENAKETGMKAHHFNENPFISDEEEVVKAITSNNSAILNKKVGGNSPIHVAVQRSTSKTSLNRKINAKSLLKLNSKIRLFAERENLVKMLIDSEPEMINVKNDKGETPLLMAIRNGNFCNAIEPIGFERMQYKALPINRLCKLGAANLTRYLISKGADTNAADATGRTPLILAVMSGNFIDCVKIEFTHCTTKSLKTACVSIGGILMYFS